MPQLSIMIKPASSACNLACKYCFYHSLSQSRKCADFGIMSTSTAVSLIQKALDFANGESIYFAFQGGEPLLIGLEYYENFVDIVQNLNKLKSKIYFSLQTNGTLLNDNWSKFFNKHDFLIGLSLDGDQNANKFRVDKQLNYIYPKVIDGLKLLQSYNVKFNILMVTTGYTAEHITEIYKYFKQNNLKYLQFIPCLRPFDNLDENELFMTTEQYSKFLITLFNHYIKDYIKGDYTSIRLFDNMVALYLNKKPEQCGINGHCSHQFVFEANGNAYPCDFYCSDEWLLGNINEQNFDQMAHSDKSAKFIKESFNIPQKCHNCALFGICRNGGCKRNRADRDYCESYKLFFKSCLPLFTVFKNEK